MKPGMKLTIAVDDISLPLPPMRAPDARQRVLENVLEIAARRGVDDVEIIMANSLHRRMTPAEIKHAVGERVYRSFWPEALKNHDAEDPDGMLHIGETDRGEVVEINRRAAESDLLVYVNINLVAMDGGHKSVPVGLAGYKSLKHHHNVHTMLHSNSYMDPPRSALHSSTERMGRLLAEHLKIFTIETTLNNDTFPSQLGFLNKREWEWSVKDQAMALAAKRANERSPARIRREFFRRIEAPYGMTGVHAGDTEAVHKETLANLHRQQLTEVHGQSDVMVVGLPYVCPYNVNSIMNPILAQCPRPRLLLQHVPRQAGRAAGRRDDPVPPGAVGVPPGAPPELRRLLRGGPRRDDRPGADRGEVRGAVRDRPLVHPPVPEQLRVPRRASVLHVVLGRARHGLPR
jgi:hypothetical protein